MGVGGIQEEKAKEAGDDDVDDAWEARQSGQQNRSAAPHPRHGPRIRQPLGKHQQTESKCADEYHHYQPYRTGQPLAKVTGEAMPYQTLKHSARFIDSV